MLPRTRWQVWVDTGGTFTDCLALDPEGSMHRAKVLSSACLRARLSPRDATSHFDLESSWKVPPGFLTGALVRPLDGRDGPPPTLRVAAHPRAHRVSLDGPLPGAVAGLPVELQFDEPAPCLAARLVTATPAGAVLPPMRMRLATTRGTNALLERRGARTAVILTEGLGDLLLIGNQQRPDLFALRVRTPLPLSDDVVQARERLDAAGRVILPLDTHRLARDAERLLAKGIRCAAIAFLHAYLNPAHELAARDILVDLGFEVVSCSSTLAPLIKILPRAQTTLVDAYLAPVVGDYVRAVRGRLGDTGGLRVMTSAGGMVASEAFRAKDSLLSGPAGGVVGARASAEAAGYAAVVSFDMGGTSTDVARIHRALEYVFEHRVGDATLVAPAVAVESVAAGGGSVCRFDGHRLRVGPQSAGARPGPACYGAGGPLTLTDVNLLLGRLVPERFGIPVDVGAARQAFDGVLQALRHAGEPTDDEARILEGFLRIANERMADAVRRISLRKGYDPADHALVAFGGAGGQFACSLASLLGMRNVVVPPDAGLLSAVGLGRARVERFAQQQISMPLHDAAARLETWRDELMRQAEADLERERVAAPGIRSRRAIVHLRFAGQDATLPVDLRDPDGVRDAFLERYRALYGYRPDEEEIEVESMRVVVADEPNPLDIHAGEVAGAPRLRPGSQHASFGGRWDQVPVLVRSALGTGDTVTGPAIVAEAHGATVVEPDWDLAVHDSGALLLTRRGSPEPARGTARGNDSAAQPVDPLERELFTHRFENLVSEMGAMLERTSRSTNVKERLDFSCALLDPQGELVVNAPHIPVHLGSLGLCVRSVVASCKLDPGDVVVTNHPAFGGSHLPDVTVVTPVHDRGGTLLGYVANRAHHAEIGGIRPGSMPPDATTLREEGVVIAPMHLIRGGRACWHQVEALLRGAPFPSRAVRDNLADLRAAVAANHHGATRLRALAEEHGAARLDRMMRALTDLAERTLRTAFEQRQDGCFQAVETLDDGSPLHVRVELSGDEATIDFAGSAAQHPGSLNATPAIVRSVVLYVLRLLVDEPLPLNEGLLRPVRLRIPRGILSPDFEVGDERAPGVVGGNVETSQRLVDALVRAFGLCACSQGTMNNVLFGDERFGYYETLGGGCGAGPGHDGASAVHSHMTNTRLTDPEVLEQRYPVRLERHAVRRGSGGEGLHRGGDGMIRELRFLRPVSVSVLSQHRREGPCGMAGGDPGLPGAQRIERADGTVERLGAIDGARVDAGDRLIIETPGGGGWGSRRSQ